MNKDQAGGEFRLVLAESAIHRYTVRIIQSRSGKISRQGGPCPDSIVQNR
jgi:hypothetical protein